MATQLQMFPQPLEIILCKWTPLQRTSKEKIVVPNHFRLVDDNNLQRQVIVSVSLP